MFKNPSRFVVSGVVIHFGESPSTISTTEPPPHPRSGSQRLQVPLLRCLLWNLQAFHVATERWGFHGWSTYTFTPLTLPPSEKKRVEIRPKIKGKQWLRKVMGIPGIVIPKKPHQRWSDSTIFLWENSLSLMYFYNMTSDHIFGRETWSLTSGICFFIYIYSIYKHILYHPCNFLEGPWSCKPENLKSSKYRSWLFHLQKPYQKSFRKFRHT